MEIPKDLIPLIREFSKPIGTRLDWRICKRHEAASIEWYHDWYYFLLYNLKWYRVKDENGYRMFFDEIDVIAYLNETKMVFRIIRFQETMPLDLTMLEITCMWVADNWFQGLLALPILFAF